MSINRPRGEENDAVIASPRRAATRAVNERDFRLLLSSQRHKTRVVMSNQVSPSGGDKAGLVQRKVEQGINLAKQDAAAVTSFGTQALKSTAYLYPV